MDGQCDKLVTVVGYCVQHGEHEASRRAGLSVLAETCFGTQCTCSYYVKTAGCTGHARK